MTKARDIADFKFEDIVDTGTEGTKVASGKIFCFFMITSLVLRLIAGVQAGVKCPTS